MNLIKYLVCVCLLSVVYCAEHDKTLLNEWTYHISGNNIKWPSLSTKNAYEQTGRFIPPNVIATRVQMYKDQVIVLTPKYKMGVPFTLGKFSVNTNNKCCSELEAYPSFQAHEDANADAIQNAVDMFLGAGQDVLWVLDVGIVNTMEEPVVRGSPKVLAIDLKTGNILKVIDLSKLTCSLSRLQYIVVEYAKDGWSSVYISDAGTRAVIVFYVAANRFYRFILPEAVVPYNHRQDVLYLALTRKSDGTAALYFKYLSSDHMFYIDTSHLRFGNEHGTVVDVRIKPSQLVLLGSDGGSNLFFRYKGQSDVYLWNTETCFQETNFIVVQSGGDSRFATQVMPGYKELMWVIENNFPDYIQSTTGCMGASVLLHPLVKTNP